MRCREKVKKLALAFYFDSYECTTRVFAVRFVAKRYLLQQKCLNSQIETCLLARNNHVQLLALYTDPESHNAHSYRQTDGQTDDRILPVADHAV